MLAVYRSGVVTGLAFGNIVAAAILRAGAFGSRDHIPGLVSPIHEITSRFEECPA